MKKISVILTILFLCASIQAEEVHRPGERKRLWADGFAYAFRWCPPGEFMMGSTSENENPVHKVKLTKGFWLLETEVTQAMWQSVMGNNPSYFSGKFLGFRISNTNYYPVEKVSWEECQQFCQKLSQKLGQTVKLPTEAQWEYACRAGTTGSYAGDLDSMAWYQANSDLKTHPVGQKKSNEWGLYDMHGNVWEWCSDYYDTDYYDRSPMSDPENTTVSSSRTLRGGCWYGDSFLCRSTIRDGGSPDFKHSFLGFRILLVASPEE